MVKVNKAVSGNKYKKELKDFSELVRQDYNKIMMLPGLAIRNGAFFRDCEYEKDKYMIPLDFDSNTMCIRVTGGMANTSKVNYDLYIGKNGNVEYDKYTYKYNEESKVLELKDKSVVSKLMDYDKIKGNLIENYGMKVNKKKAEDLVKLACRSEYIKVDKSLEECASKFNMSKEDYLKRLGNVSMSGYGDRELVSAYQKRIADKYNEGWSYKEIYKYFNTKKEPVYRAIKEQSDRITDKDKFEELLLRCYAEGMNVRELNKYFKLIKVRGYTVGYLNGGFLRKGKELRKKGGYLSVSEKKALKLYRNGVPLHELVHAVQDELGRERGQETYWRGYTRILIGIRDGAGKLKGKDLGDFYKNAEESRPYINGIDEDDLWG